MKPTYLMLLWHMHQPFYKDLAEGVYTMPWVRLHALKDYYGMVAILKDYPSVHVTFNLVPSLVAQLEDYAQDRAREADYEIVFKPADKLTVEERQKLFGLAFQLNHENMLNRYPRFRELFEKLGTMGRSDSPLPATSQDLLDLQVLSQVAWFDEIYLEGDPEIRDLVARGRGYVESDKSLLHKKEIELFNKTLEEYRRAAERGQIELSTSPFYHPILPLLCDSVLGAESHPGVRLPRRRFRHPEDARAQLREAVQLHQRIFGRRPQGLWPSEGSISDEVLGLAAEEGFKWTATDEGVLGRSLQMEFRRQDDGTVRGGEELYRPHRFADRDRQIALFFRDHQLSDLIGFVYSRMDPAEAAADLHQRIRAAARSTGQRSAVVSIILDGENAWEFYPENGRDFLRRFYGRLASDPELQAVTASEALELAEPGTLTHVVPGSWINANFDIWIGAEEDNRAWDLLADARDFLAEQMEKAEVPSERARLAREELWISEGSDWCWWYGPEHSTPLDEEFDLLFRKHLSNLYRLLNASPPDELAVPIQQPRARGKLVPPSGRIEPRVDGQLSNYFEWLGAGLYEPDYSSGSMHGGERYIEALHYGLSDQALYLRLDLNQRFVKSHPKFELRVNFEGEVQTRVHAIVGQSGGAEIRLYKGDEVLPAQPGQVEVALGLILELRLDSGILSVASPAKPRIQVSLWVDEIPVQIIPQQGWLPLEFAGDLVSW